MDNNQFNDIVIPAGEWMTRQQVVEFYKYDLERDIQYAMMPKPFARKVVVSDGKIQVVRLN